MAEPISLALGAISLGIQAIQVSKKLLEVVLEAKEAPKVLQALAGEIDSFEGVTKTLDLILREPKVQQSIVSDPAIQVPVTSFINTLSNCQSILAELNAKLSRLRRPRFEQATVQASLVGIKWSLISRSDFARIRRNLETEKSTLVVALNSLNFMISIRVLHTVEGDRGASRCYSSERNPGNATNSSNGLEELRVIAEAGLNRSPQVFPRPDMDLYSFRDTLECIREVLSPISWMLQDVTTSQNLSDAFVRSTTAQIYQDPGAASAQTQPLNVRRQGYGNKRMDPTISLSRSYSYGSVSKNLYSRWETSTCGNKSVLEAFYDSLSSVPNETFSRKVERRILGSAEYRFESLPSFYPEKYVTTGFFDEDIFLVTKFLPNKDIRVIRYVLLYAESARCWRSIVVDACFSQKSDAYSDLRAHALAHVPFFVVATLPSAMRTLLQNILPSIGFYQRGTRVRLDITSQRLGDIVITPPKLRVSEAWPEWSKSEEARFLEYANKACWKSWVENEIVATARLNNFQYKVRIGSQSYSETKAQVLSYQEDGCKILSRRIELLKHHVALMQCSAGIIAFIGIVLDATRSQLRSFLFELPDIPLLSNFLVYTGSNQITLPWAVKELWARQIIQILIDVHSKGLFIGNFDLEDAALRSDGSIAFCRARSMTFNLRDRSGCVPPELRMKLTRLPLGQGVHQHLNQETDIFFLGHVLWLLFWQLPIIGPHFCHKNSCNYRPRVDCPYQHANPITLPRCPEGTPAYLCNIIDRCREDQPAMRITHHELQATLESAPPPDTTSADIQQILVPYIQQAPGTTHLITCDDCGKITTNLHYHCGLCLSGDYDICEECFEQGRRCHDSGHRLMKRALGKLDFVDIS